MQESKYIISEFYSFKPDLNLVREAEEKNMPVIMSGIFQKANTLNRNGRVYPYDILRREATKYMELIENDLAGGELDHPDCQTYDSKILTKNGWKFLPDIAEDEEIITLNLKTGKSEIQKIEKKIDQFYKGEMYHILGRNIDILTTPNHRFLVENKKNELEYITADKLSSINKKSYKFLKTTIWEGNHIENIVINKIPKENLSKKIKKDLAEKYTKDLVVNAEWFFKFMGFYLSEGDVFGTKNGKARGFQIQITQKKKEIVDKIREITNNLSSELIWKERVDVNGTTRFTVRDARLHNYLFKLGNSSEKYIPIELKQATPHLLNLLFENFLLGDGRTVKRSYYKKEDNCTKKQSVFSTSKKLIEDLQEILFKIGKHGNITTYQPKDREIWDTKFIEKEIDNGDGTLCLEKVAIKIKRIIKSKNSKIQYNINISSVDHINLEKIKIEKINFNNRVYCVRVPNGNFYTMRNGKSFWTGNSAVISLSNISHKVIDMWWQGEELYGKVQIAETRAGDTLKGLLKTGFRLGISSRGVGSVKTIKGEDVVQSDFELLAFDFVSSPSTPGAYMFKEGRQWGMTPITEETYKKIKCENGICKIVNEIEKPKKLIIPDSSIIVTSSNCMCEGYEKLFTLANNEFWKKNL